MRVDLSGYLRVTLTGDHNEEKLPPTTHFSGHRARGIQYAGERRGSTDAGSHRDGYTPGQGLTSYTPIASVDDTQLKQLGTVNVEEFLNTMPQIAAGENNSANFP